MPGYDVESWHNIIEVIFAILNAIYYKKLILKNGVPFFSPQSLVHMYQFFLKQEPYLQHLFTMFRIFWDMFNQLQRSVVLQFSFETIFCFTKRYNLEFHWFIMSKLGNSITCVIKWWNTFTIKSTNYNHSPEEKSQSTV